MQGVGLAGCGRMGAPMLAALRRGRIPARGFDVRPPEDFGALSGAMTDDPDAFATGLKTLITVVRDITQSEAVLFGRQGFVTRAAELETIVICSTLSPRWVKALQDRVPARIALVDAPMSGAVIGAEEARLTFMLGGAKADVQRLMPIFRAMGRHIQHMGGFGAGMTAKVLNNLLAATNTAMTRIVLDWADAMGLDERGLLALIATSSGQNWFASGFEQIEFARHGYEPDNTIAILVKDVESALDAVPGGAEAAIPNAVREALRNLRPRQK